MRSSCFKFLLIFRGIEEQFTYCISNFKPVVLEHIPNIDIIIFISSLWFTASDSYFSIHLTLIYSICIVTFLGTKMRAKLSLIFVYVQICFKEHIILAEGLYSNCNYTCRIFISTISLSVVSVTNGQLWFKYLKEKILKISNGYILNYVSLWEGWWLLMPSCCAASRPWIIC